MLPAIFGSAVYQFNQFMGTLLASFLEEGSVSWLYYADRLVQFPLGVFAIAISTAALPSLSSQAAEKELERFEATLAHALRLVFFITLPATAGLIVLGRPIISILFERGAFDARATVMTDLALVCYALGLWAFSGIRVVVAAYYALQDTKTPVKVAVLSVMVNIMFSLFLAFMTPLRHGGLALALSIASAVQFFLLVILLQRKISMKNLKLVMVPAAKHVIAATIMGLCVYLLHSGWLTVQREMGAWRMIWELMCLIGIGMFIYFGVARILGCEEFKAIRDMIQPFGRRIRRRQATGGD
jgi:putative peptidoglycan lipid II flippase